MANNEVIAIGIVTVSDRASSGVYQDTSGPAVEQFLQDVVTTPWRAVSRLVPDGIESVRDALIQLADRESCALIFTTGGTGPAPRDLTPEATAAACTRLMPGFGEMMRTESLKQVPTAILSSDRWHSWNHPHHQSARTPNLNSIHHASGVSSNSLLPGPDWRSPNGNRPCSLQGLPAATIARPTDKLDH